MEKIKIANNITELNRFDYFWNGRILQAIVSKEGKRKGDIVGAVPKKYWEYVFTEPGIVCYAKITDSIPRKVKKTFDKSEYRYFDIKDKFHHKEE